MGLFQRPTETRSITRMDLWGSNAYDLDRRLDDPLKALQLSAVAGCVRILNSLMAQMSVDTFKDDEHGSPIKVDRALTDNPSPGFAVPAIWRTQLSMSRALWGNAFGYVNGFDTFGYPKGCDWLEPWRVTTTQAKTLGPLTFYVDGEEVDPERIILIPSMYVSPGSPLGRAPLEASGLVELGKLAQEFGRDWFRNGAVPSTVVTVDQPIGAFSADDADDLRDRIAKAWRNRRPAVVGAGVTVENTEVKANESQFLETQRHVQVDICQRMGIPPEALGIASAGSSVTYQNREDATNSMLVYGLNGDLCVIQDVLSAAMPRGYYARFNTGALLRSNLKERYDAYRVALGPTQPFMDVQEARSQEHLPYKEIAAPPPAPAARVAISKDPHGN